MGTPSTPRNRTSRAASITAPSRRELLKGLPIAGLATAAAASLPELAQAAEPAAVDPQKVLFDESDHVRRFYALARR